MAVIRRCDSCQAETPFVVMSLGSAEDDWYSVYRADGENVMFCSDGCLTDYYVSKRMIDGVM